MGCIEWLPRDWDKYIIKEVPVAKIIFLIDQLQFHH
jgi:hypothetical protein